MKCCDHNSRVCKPLWLGPLQASLLDRPTCAELPHLELPQIACNAVAWCCMGGPQCTRQQFGGSQSELNCLSGNYVECRCPGTFVNLSPENLKMYQYKLIIISRRVNISGVEGNCPFSSFSLELPKGY